MAGNVQYESSHLRYIMQEKSKPRNYKRMGVLYTHIAGQKQSRARKEAVGCKSVSLQTVHGDSITAFQGNL